MSNAVIVKTRKFKRNPLLARKQVRPRMLVHCWWIGKNGISDERVFLVSYHDGIHRCPYCDLQ